MATINNVAYSWSMIQLTASSLGGDIFVDCTAISWNTERTVESVYGLGGQPRKRGFGNVTYAASITLPYGTQLQLRSKSTDGTLMGLGEFNLVVSWVNDLAASVTSETVTLAGCIFTQSGMEAKQNDTNIEKEFDLHPHRIYTPTVSDNGKTKWGEMYSGS